MGNLLQYHVTTYFDNEASGIPATHRFGRPLKTLAQRLKGKKVDLEVISLVKG